MKTNIYNKRIEREREKRKEEKIKYAAQINSAISDVKNAFFSSYNLFYSRFI